MQGSRWVLLFMVGSLGLLIALFQVRSSSRQPEVVRVRAAQWVLSTDWMVQRYHERHGRYPECGGGRSPCWEVLGWMNRPRRIDGYSLTIRRAPSAYRVEAEGPSGKWVLEPGSPLRWEAARTSD